MYYSRDLSQYCHNVTSDRKYQIFQLKVREVFSSAIKVGDWTEIAEALRGSDELLEATWAGDEENV